MTDDLKKQYIKDMQAGDLIKSAFLVIRKENRKGKNDKDFIDLELQDNTGKISAKIWSNSLPGIEVFKKKDIVFIEGRVEDSYGRQINIKNLKRIKDSTLDYSLFAFSSRKVDTSFLENLTRFLISTISGVKNIFLKKLLESFFAVPEFLEKFAKSTAAIKNHHALEGGLLMHTISMVKICDFIADLYKETGMIDRGMLITGAIFHDIGKTVGYSVDGFLDINDEESLISHISLGYGMVLEKINSIKGFPEKSKQELLHIILSHHGAKEFGSPVEPQTLEAIIVYNTDRLDADIDHYLTLLKDSLERDVFQYSNYFRRRIFLKSNHSAADKDNDENVIKRNRNFAQDRLL